MKKLFLLLIMVTLLFFSFNFEKSVGAAELYKVKQGDTLTAISKKYGVTIKEIQVTNNLKSTTIKSGQTLKIPNDNVYRVKKGDTLYSIAKKYDRTVQELKTANSLTTTTIQTNQLIKIPQKGIKLQSITINQSIYSFDLASTVKTASLKVTAKYSDGTTKDVTANTMYASSNTTVATVSSSGLLTAKAKGTSTITVTHSGLKATTTVNVTSSVIKTPSSISTSESVITLAQNATKSIVVTAKYSDSSTENVTTKSAFISSNASVATISASGLVTAVGNGTAVITVQYGELTKTISITVTQQVNVKDFGAIGNGTVDDTAAFQAAIDNMASKGSGDVFVPAGTYRLKSITVKSNVNLVGESRDTVTIKLIDNAPDWTRIVNVDTVQNVKIQNITFDGNYAKNTTGNEHMHSIFVWNSKNVVIDGNRMNNAVADGISISGGWSEEDANAQSDGVTISNNILANNHRSNIVLEQVSHLDIYNNTSTSDIGRPVLHFEPWEERNLYDAKIHNNTFSSNAANGDYCVQLEGGKEQGNYFNEVEFTNNTVNCPNGRFLVMETNGAKIHDNDLTVDQFYVWLKNKDLEVYNNKMATNKGINIEGTWGMVSPNTNIHHNTVTTKNDALAIIAGSATTTIANNSFTGVDSTGVALYMWATTTDIANTTLSSNTFKNFYGGVVPDYDSYGPYRVNGLTIQGNTFTNASANPFEMISRALNTNVNGNIIN